jgi:hypothetical protein
MQADIEIKEYRIVRLDKDSLKDLEKLYIAVYGIAPAENYFYKKYDTAYTGVEYAGYIAYNRQNIPVAYYGVIPCFIRYNRANILAAQSGDTMTDPAYRYKGMFVELSKITFELCKQSGIAFIFGFPNQHSYHGAVHKLGWKLTENMYCFTVPVNTVPLASLSNRFPWLKKLYRKYAGSILNKYALQEKGVANSVIDDGYAGLYRGDRYLQYKTYGNTKVIRAGKAKAWISMNTNLTIGDLALGGEDFDTTIDTIKKIAAKLGIRQVLFHACINTRLHSLFLARYKAIPSFPVLFQDLGTDVAFDKIKFTFADIDIF